MEFSSGTREEESTDKLESEQIHHIPKDHCDLLLDAIDEQLSRLQAQRYKTRSHDKHCSSTDHLVQNGSTYDGIGSKIVTTDNPALHLPRVDMEVATSEGKSRYKDTRTETTKEEDSDKQNTRRLIGWDREVVPERNIALGSICQWPHTDTYLSKCSPKPIQKSELSSEPTFLQYETSARVEERSRANNEKTSSPFYSNGNHNTSLIRRGVALRNFDTVTTYSDLESVSTVEVRHCFQNASKDSTVSKSSKCLLVCDLDLDTSDINKQGGNKPLTKLHNRRESSRFCDGDGGGDKEDGKEFTADQESHRLGQYKSLPKSKAFSSLNPMKSKRDSEISADRIQLEGHLSSLRQDCVRVEEKLRRKKTQLHQTDSALTGLLQQKKHALQELRCVQLAVDQAERERQDLESRIKDSRAQYFSTRSQLCNVQEQKDDCVQDLQELEEQLAELRRATGSDKKMHCSRMSVHEREEMERQLECSNAELLAERHHARQKLDSLLERLEETQQELEQHMESERKLKEKCTRMEEHLIHRKEEQNQQRSCKTMQALQRELEVKSSQVIALERVVAQKELQLLGSQKEQATLRVESEGLRMQMQTLREQHCSQLMEAQEKAHTEKLTEKELKQLEASMGQQREGLRRESQDMREQEKAKAEKQKEILEREKTRCLNLQNKVVELQSQLQEHKLEMQRQQQNQQSALSTQHKALREEHQAELQRIRTQVEQAEDKHRNVEQALAESIQLHEESVTVTQKQQRDWIMELEIVCQCLQELLEQRGATDNTVLTKHSSVDDVVWTLRTLAEQIYSQQELEAQKCSTQQVIKEKEQQLYTQRDQMSAEKLQAQDPMREWLIKEHMKEVSNLKQNNVHDTGDVITVLQRQLRDKDTELREVQRNMGMWKEHTTHQLARKFEVELTAELERATQPRTEEHRRLQRLEKDVMELTKDCIHPGGLLSASSPSLSADPSSHLSGLPDTVTLKLLRHLQGRVRQLRADNSAHITNPTHPAMKGDLVGSYLETIAPSHVRLRSKSITRPVPSCSSQY